MAPKRAQLIKPKPEDLFKGSVVIYDNDRWGVVTDAFAPLDQFWVNDEQSNEPVRDKEGQIVSFSAGDLLLAPQPERPKGGEASGCARVLLIGTEQHMLQILEQFGAPEASERRETQQLLAVPCTSMRCGASCARFDPCRRAMCNRDECPLLNLATEGIDDAMHGLAQRLRPDIFIDVRAFHLKQAVEQIGPDLKKLEGYYCLSAVTLPFGQAEIEAKSGWERYWMEDVRCQIDLGVSAEGACEADEHTFEETAKRALGEACGLCLSDRIWSETVQFQMRQKYAVDLPIKYWDGPETKVFVLIMPEDCVSSLEKGLLVFSEAAGKGAAKTAGRKTIKEWEKDQAEFSHLPKLPPGWIRVRSTKNSNEIYYWDTRTNKPSYTFPLPDGWTVETSKSTGKTYYFNAKKRKSTFEVPAE